MTREESREVEGVTLTLLRHATSLGYTVSVSLFPSSVLGTPPACVEMHALDPVARYTSPHPGICVM
jgi:hypothetical protein